MFQTNKQSRSIAVEFSSKTGLAFRAIKECLEYLGKFSADSRLIDTRVIIRELLMNALEHGNKSNQECFVKCRVEQLGDKRLKILVEDQGNGFDHRNVLRNLDDLEDPVKRSGYFLIKKLSERIEFNDKGNRVTAYQKFRDWTKVEEGKYLTFTLADEEYGIGILKIKEVIGMIGKDDRAPDTGVCERGVKILLHIDRVLNEEEVALLEKAA